jgi:chromosome segregation ATPase
MLKISIKKSNEEVKHRDRALKDVNKLVKIQEKEIYNLQQRLDNFLETVQTLKQSNLDLKKEVKESNTASKSAEKKTSIELKKSESKVKNLEEELSEKQRIISDLNSARSKAGISDKVSTLHPAQPKSKTKYTTAISDEITHQPSMNYSTTSKKSSNFSHLFNLLISSCIPIYHLCTKSTNPCVQPLCTD